MSEINRVLANDLASVASRQSTVLGSEVMSMAGKTDGLFSTISGHKEKIHPMVRPFYSHLEVMDFLATQKMNNLVHRQDKSKVLHRDERQYIQRK